MSSEFPRAHPIAGESGDESLSYALHAALWPILADGKGDFVSIKNVAKKIKAKWLDCGRTLNEVAFEEAVNLWAHWANNFPEVRAMLEGVISDFPESRQHVHLFVMPLLLDAMWVEVPNLDFSDGTFNDGPGRPRKDMRSYLVSRVFDGLEELFRAYPKDQTTYSGLRKVWRWHHEGNEYEDQHEDDDGGLNRRRDFGLFSSRGDLGCREQCIEFLHWLMPSMEGLAKRTLQDMLREENRRMMVDEPWLTDAERSALNEPCGDEDTTTVKCSSCGREKDFSGLAKKANEAARVAGWLIDTHKTSNSRYRCPECQGEPESRSVRVPPKPGKNHAWRRK